VHANVSYVVLGSFSLLGGSDRYQEIRITTQEPDEVTGE
jgi:hypothetical protein